MPTERMTLKEYRSLAGLDLPKKQPRVRNAKRTEADGITFDSKREADAYRDLKVRLAAGEIRNLKRQVTFPLVVKGCPIYQEGYRADFTFDELQHGEWVYTVMDAKGFRTETYTAKKKLMRAIYGIVIREV